MAPAILGYFGLGNGVSTTKPEIKEPVRALPASWYTSQEMYELEKRAIFSKKWLLITHRSRLAEPGDFLKFKITDFEIVLAKDRKGQINGFHNVCRHRAFPVVQSQGGNAKIFACRYHGWSYGLDGKLAKAPRYEEFSGFDKSKNGMFPIHVKEDSNGFIYVNLSSADTPEPWETEFDGIDRQERWKQYNFEDYVLDHEYQMSGNYNWKILADNFNECYHCPTTHPDVPDLADIESHDVDTKLSAITHKSELTEEQKKKGLGLSSTYFFPNSSIVVLRDFLMVQRFLPTSPHNSTMHYQIFRNKHSTAADFAYISTMYRRIMTEDKGLCELVQSNLNSGIFVNGELHARLEKGPLYFQKVNREVIRQHWKLEQAAKREIWPARQNLPESAAVSREDEELCSGLACRTDQEGIVW